MAYRQSKSTHTLLTKLSTIKHQKESIVDRLNQGISRNNQLIEEPVNINRRCSQKVINNRERSMDILKSKLRHKVEEDHKSGTKLQAVSFKNQKRRQKLEKRLEQLAHRNEQRLKQLKSIEETVISKINQDIKQNQLKQKHLKQQYSRIKKQSKQINEVNRHQRGSSLKQWRQMQSQKWKLQLFVRQQEEKQKLLIQDKNPKLLRKQEKRKQNEKYIPNEKQFNRLKNPVNKDSKEVGKQYLEQAKVLHREVIANNKKKKLLNLNLKVINYDRQIMDRIFRNTSDLSKAEKPAFNTTMKNIVEEKQSSKDREEEEGERINSDFVVSEDLETQKYIKRIRGNIEELEKFNRNNEGNGLQDRSVSDKLLVPTTFQGQNASH